MYTLPFNKESRFDTHEMVWSGILSTTTTYIKRQKDTAKKKITGHGVRMGSFSFLRLLSPNNSILLKT